MTSSDTARATLPAAPPNVFRPKRYAVATAAALVPAVGVGVYHHGPLVLLSVAAAYAGAAVAELAFSRVRRKEWRVGWGLLTTGILFAAVMPAGVPLWMVALGAAFGVFFAQEVFGGEGHTIFHPVLVGKCFLWVSWPGTLGGALAGAATASQGADAVGRIQPFVGLFAAPGPGGIGEASALLLVLGGVVAIGLGVAKRRILITTLASAAAMSAILWLADAEKYPSPNQVICSGSLMMAVCFLAPHPVNSPSSGWGQVLFGGLTGVLAVLIKSFSAYGTYTEAVMFAVLLGELFAPAIDDAVVALGRGPGGAGAEAAGDAEAAGGADG